MNGWQRVGVVLSALVGVPALMIGYDSGDSGYATVYASQATLSHEGQNFWNALYKQAQTDYPESMGSCILRTVKMEYNKYGESYTVTCRKSTWHAVDGAVRTAIIPVSAIWIIGYAIGWVYRGFRPKRAAKSES